MMYLEIMLAYLMLFLNAIVINMVMEMVWKVDQIFSKFNEGDYSH